jgi:hypothetical protein
VLFGLPSKFLPLQFFSLTAAQILSSTGHPVRRKGLLQAEAYPSDHWH